MNLSVTTIRHDLNKQQLADIMTMYQTDGNLMKRIDIDKLAKTGVSKVDFVENGIKITSVVEITDKTKTSKESYEFDMNLSTRICDTCNKNYIPSGEETTCGTCLLIKVGKLQSEISWIKCPEPPY